MLLIPKTVFIGEHVNVIIIGLSSVLHTCNLLYNFAIFIHGSQKPTNWPTQIKKKHRVVHMCVCMRVRGRVSEG